MSPLLKVSESAWIHDKWAGNVRGLAAEDVLVEAVKLQPHGLFPSVMVKEISYRRCKCGSKQASEANEEGDAVPKTG